MPVEPSKESFLHTVRTFWTGKRFLKLFIFALLLGNVTLYCVGMLARRQVISNAITHHGKVYTAYMQAVERARNGEAGKTGAAKEGDAAVSESPAAVSPFWIALHEVRKQFPFYKMNVLLPATVQGERDRRVMDMLHNRPRGWMVADENEGWARSFYVLPTKNTAAFQVVSFVSDELSAWETTAMMIGGYAFMLLFAFGWFWTRALDEGEAPKSQFAAHPELSEKVAAIGSITEEIGMMLEDLKNAIDRAEQGSGDSDNSEVVVTLDEIAAQVRLLAINGAVEAARSQETHRVFHIIMQEINQLAAQSRELLKNLKPQFQMKAVREKIEQMQAALGGPTVNAGGGSGFSAGGRRQPPSSSSSTSSRRAG